MELWDAYVFETANVALAHCHEICFETVPLKRFGNALLCVAKDCRNNLMECSTEHWGNTSPVFTFLGEGESPIHLHKRNVKCSRSLEASHKPDYLFWNNFYGLE